MSNERKEKETEEREKVLLRQTQRGSLLRAERAGESKREEKAKAREGKKERRKEKKSDL